MYGSPGVTSARGTKHNEAGDRHPDAELLAAVKAGDEAAYERLFSGHRAAAVAFARSRYGDNRAEDLVADAFLNILLALRRGNGPDTAFRPYLYITIRHLAERSGRLNKREIISAPEELFDSSGDLLQLEDHQESYAEADALRQAFKNLPPRWQEALWHAEVEQESYEDLGDRLGIKSNAVAALTFRAREGLRRAYLAQHAGSTSDSCTPFVQLLPADVRGELGAKQRAGLVEHKAECAECSSAFDTLRSINTNLGAVIFPALVGIPVVSRLAKAAGAGATASGHALVKVLATIVASGVVIGGMALLRNDPEAQEAGATTQREVRVTQPATAQESVAIPPARTNPTTTPGRATAPNRSTAEPSPNQTTPSPSATVDEQAQTATPKIAMTATPQAPATTALPSVDVGFGQPSIEPLATGSEWMRVHIPISSVGTSVQARFVLTGIDDYVLALGGERQKRVFCRDQRVQPDGRKAFTCEVSASPDSKQQILTVNVVPQDLENAAISGQLEPTDRADLNGHDNAFVQHF